MRFLLATILISLMPATAQAIDEFEAHDRYVQCFAKASQDLMPSWCHNSDQLANFAHQACLQEAVVVQETAKVRKPKQALQNAQLSAQLVMYDLLRSYKANPGCDR